ncbi:MAG TPA: PQQ-binding-like beta-propeller repeat protein [Gemmataceae bacterium]|nr:PQQ-binding-like beta-propeller repeat protein [Gemmataceae bacterium]
MKSYRTLRRWLAAGISLAVLGVVVALVAHRSGPIETAQKARADEIQAKISHAWALFGGSASRNMVNTLDKNIPFECNVDKGQEKNIKWSAQLGSKSYGGPIIAGGQVYAGTNNEAPRNPKITGDKGILMCFKESDGSFLWQAVHDKLASGIVNDWTREGLCSTPCVEGNRVYYVSNRCELVCAATHGFLDGKNDGAQDEQYKSKLDADFIWRLDMMKELNVFPHNMSACAPLIVGSIIFVVTANGVDEGHINVPSPKAPSFIAVDKKTGKLLWSDNSPSVALLQGAGKEADFKQLVNKGELLMHGQWSNPAYAEVNGHPQVIFPGGDGWLRSFEPATGKLLWKFDCNPKDSKYELGGRGTRSDFIATPVVYDKKVYIGVGQDPEHYEGVGHLWCIDLEKADRLGQTNKDNDVSPRNDNFDPKNPVNKDSALHWHFGGPVSADLAAKIGRDYQFGRTMSTCAIHDGIVYVGELAGYLHCLDAQTGEEYWNHDLKAAIWGSAYWVDGKVYIGTEDGDIYVFSHGKEKKVLGKMDMKHAVRSTPVVANGVMYILTESVLYAIAKP